ncbi:hypothetical protein AB0M28_07980 [Streptomyces sp. NPDC051940]|uniref:hypothetical protein n=1 Tax=Streptomyces sp. NPDC051940 TaxID=3155675 RepID=UPI003448EA8E
MSSLDDFQDRCEQLYAAGGRAEVRRAAAEGLERVGPHPDLYCWLALGHVREDDDDHDTEAERAFRAGLKLDPDHLGLLAGYAALCLRSDGFDHPGRAARAVELTARLEELAPESAYARELRAAHPEDRRAAVLAATLEDLAGAWMAPVRLMLRHRAAAWVAGVALSLLTNLGLRMAGVVLPWGWLWLLPLWLLDRRLAAARRRGEQEAVARLEERLAGEAAVRG